MSERTLMKSVPAKLSKDADDAPLRAIVTRAAEHAAAIFSADNIFPDRSGKTQSVDLASEFLPIADGKLLSGSALDVWHRRVSGDYALRQVGIGILLCVKQLELGKKEFRDWCKAESYSTQQASDLMAVARMFGQHQRPVLVLVARLQTGAQRSLAHLPSATVDRIADDGTLDKLLDMSQREAVQAITTIRLLEQKNSQLMQRIEERDQQDRLQQAGARHRYPKTVETARISGATQSMFATEALGAIERLAFDLLEGVDLSADPTERKSQLRAGCGPLYVGVRGVLARANETLALLSEQLGEYLPEFDTEFLSASELLDAKSALAVMLKGTATPPTDATAKRGRKAGRGKSRR